MKTFFKILIALVLIVSLMLIIWEVPIYQSNKIVEGKAEITIEDKIKKFEAEDKARNTMLKIIGGIFVGIGVYFTWKKVFVSNEGQITDRYSKAVGQLGHDKFEVRLGGIYALERIAHESKKDRNSILQVLSAYVRHRYPRNGNIIDDNPDSRIDLKAILKIITSDYFKSYKIDLSNSDLHKVNLNGANLYEANLKNCDLSYSYLHDAIMKGCVLNDSDMKGVAMVKVNLKEACIEGVILSDATLNEAILEKTLFNGVDMSNTQFQKAKFQEASLVACYFDGAYLEGAKFKQSFFFDSDLRNIKANSLKKEQLEGVSRLYKTKLDKEIHEHMMSKFPKLFESPYKEIESRQVPRDGKD